ncbi:MAG: hypothetical protein A2Y33_15595 [Spirochaetes bacterium GWF1_51_8]|nr:MAG: hypothetical protein A2Y33_15595 [Spirochaetes bacterium GWF1_51_8]
MKIDRGPCFIDTNILIYASFPENKFYEKALDCIETLRPQGLYISRQIVLEYVSVVTNENIYNQYLTSEEAVENIEVFLEYMSIIEPGTPLDTHALKKYLIQYAIKRRMVFDLNIYLTMKANGIPVILTANEKDFNAFQDIEIINPVK